MNLNDPSAYKKNDSKKVADSISALPLQLEQAFKEANIIKIPNNYKNINKIVVNGMGGSNLGARIIKTAFSENLKVPLLIVPGYHIPKYVDKNTLYIISSYSGNTEEPLSVYKEIKKRNARIAAITSNNKNNKLKKLIIKNNIPSYIFEDTNNPSDQPRLGVGYTIAGTIMIIKKARLLNISKKEINNAILYLKNNDKNLLISSKNNLAKKISLNLYGKLPILVSSEFLSANVHVLRNQLNECSKLFSSYLLIPELNHYAMEGLVNPNSNKKNLIFLFFSSKLFHKRNQKRIELTKQIIKKNKIKIINCDLKAKTKIGQALELLQIGSWISYYTGILYKVNPINIPWVDWFKEKLK